MGDTLALAPAPLPPESDQLFKNAQKSLLMGIFSEIEPHTGINQKLEHGLMSLGPRNGFSGHLTGAVEKQALKGRCLLKPHGYAAKRMLINIIPHPHN